MMKKILMTTLLLVSACAQMMAEDADSLYAKDLLKPGTVAPDFMLRSNMGEMKTFSNYRGSYVVLEFWASWCPDCRKDMPRMKALNDAYRQKGVRLMGVSFDTDFDKWNGYITANKLYWAQVSELKKWKKETAIDTLYHVNWIPSYYVIDPEGRITLATVDLTKVEGLLARLDADGTLARSKKPEPVLVQPQFTGGNEALANYLSAHLKYPASCTKAGAAARVVCEFVVERDGSLTDVRVSKVSDFHFTNAKVSGMTKGTRAKLQEECEGRFKVEAVRVVSEMPNWTPGTQDGKPVLVKYHLPISFSL